MDPERINVIIGALGTVLAAFVGVLTWYLASHAERRREREEREAVMRGEEAQREQRVLDLVVALHSEILAGIIANRRQLTPEDASYALRQVNPFATPDDTDFVFDAVKGDFSILPAEVIHSVVQYYRAAKQSNLLTKDLRDPSFLAQSAKEKRRIIELLLQILELQKVLGEAAMADLAAYADRNGLDLKASERRATELITVARADLKDIFKKSEQLDPSLRSPVSRRSGRARNKYSMTPPTVKEH
jgi:hypothetical protein